VKKDDETTILYAVDQDNNKVYQIQITEYIVQERSSLIGSYFWNQQLCLAVFGVDSKESFDTMESLVDAYEDWNTYSPWSQNVIVIGNKLDVKKR